MDIAVDLPLEDLVAVVRIGLERGRALLTAGELAIARRIAALEGPPGRLYARLSGRVPEVFRLEDLDLPGVDDPGSAAAALIEAELVDRLVPGPARAEQLTIPELKQALAGLGLARGGRKAELVARLGPHRVHAPGKWIRIRHRALVRRLERWAFLRVHADRRTLVVERLGHVVWPEYTPTPGPGLHRDRRALLAWEALLTEALTVEQALAALATGATRAAGPLDRSRRIARALAERARELERSDPAAAVTLYQSLSEVGHPADPVRHARALEQSGAPEQALRLLRDALDRHHGPTRLAIHRSGRRLARSLRAGWAPDPPLLAPRRRTLRMPPGAPTHRPRYRVDGGAHPIEQALIAELGALGRRAIHAENGLWTQLFALLFAEAYFLPVPGALPTRWLSGPLDLGGPRFFDRRRPTLDRILDAVRAGEGPARIAEADARWRGIRLAGARWDLRAEDVAAVAEGLGGAALAEILTVLLERGWPAARGLPDLAILPGDPVLLPHAVPQRLGPDLLLAELKGPGDTVRDAQALWFHRLRSAGAPIALWEVRPLPEDPEG